MTQTLSDMYHHLTCLVIANWRGFLVWFVIQNSDWTFMKCCLDSPFESLTKDSFSVLAEMCICMNLLRRIRIGPNGRCSESGPRGSQVCIFKPLFNNCCSNNFRLHQHVYPCAGYRRVIKLILWLFLRVNLSLEVFPITTKICQKTITYFALADFFFKFFKL